MFKSMKTEAVVIGTDSVARLTEVELPPMTDTRVKVQTLISGVSCGTEADLASGRSTYLKRPLITGYQAAGKVIETGGKADNVQAGGLVVTNGGELWGMTHLFGGSHARQCVSEASGLVKLKPGAVSLATASYGGLGAVSWEGIARMKLERGNVLLVFGLGMLGLLAGRVAQSLGLHVIGVNRSAWKREAAEKFGFDAVAAPEAGEIQKTLDALGSGPAKFAYETTGSQQIIDLALASLASGGELSLGGYYPGKYEIDFDLCHGKNLRLHNPVGTGNYLGKFIGLVESGLNAESLIQTRVKPGEVTAFYSELINHHSKFLGAVIDWQS